MSSWATPPKFPNKALSDHQFRGPNHGGYMRVTLSGVCRISMQSPNSVDRPRRNVITPRFRKLRMLAFRQEQIMVCALFLITFVWGTSWYAMRLQIGFAPVEVS